MGEMGGRHLLVEPDRLRFGAPEQVLLVFKGEAIEVAEVVDPTLGDGDGPPAPGLTSATIATSRWRSNSGLPVLSMKPVRSWLAPQTQAMV